MDVGKRRTGTHKLNGNSARDGNGQHDSNGQLAGGNGSNGVSRRTSAPGAASRRTPVSKVLSPMSADTPVPRSSLSSAELDRYRRMLLAKRDQLLGAVTHMENEALGKSRSESAGDLSQMPIHMADIGTDNYEQEFTLGLIANERETLKEIDEALARIDAGTYGVCLGTHKPISKARLDARPWARYCIEYHRQQEQRGRGG